MTDAIYEPSENPRYLAPVDDSPPPALISPEMLERAYADLQTLSETVEVFKLSGWAHLRTTIENELALARQRMEKAEDLATMHRQQGIIYACRWLLDLPGKIQREQERLVDVTSQAEASA